MTKKITYYLVALIACCYFWSAFIYAVGFMLNIVVPKSIDSGAEGPIIKSLIVNVLLLSAFGVQHSVMARKSFKKWLIKFVPEPLERSVYVISASTIIWIIMMYWQPLTGTIWNFQNLFLRLIFDAAFIFGCIVTVYSIFLHNHFDYVGLRQVYLHFQRGEYVPLKFQMPSIYKYVRHPMVLGVIIFSFSTPSMTVGHLLFAIGMTIYGLIGLTFEELDLIEQFGDEYIMYKQKVNMFIPLSKAKQ